MAARPTIEPVPRVENIPVDEFRREYDEPGKPVVISNALRWPAFDKWTHEWFKRQYGAIEVPLTVNPTHTNTVLTIRLDAYIDRILKNYRMGGGLYLAQFPLDRLPGLSEDFSRPQYCRHARKVVMNLWLGPGATVVSLHKDNHDPFVLNDNVFVQICGRKLVMLASPENDALMYPRSRETGAYWHSEVNPEMPDLQRFPLFAHAKLSSAVVGPGDIIFIPRDYWHYVRALEPSISLSFWSHPHRLMEVGRIVRQLTEDEFERVCKSGRWNVTMADITEFGGVAHLQSVFSKFFDWSSVENLGQRLRSLADTEAEIAISQALNGARRVQSTAVDPE